MKKTIPQFLSICAFLSALSAPVVQAQQDCKPHYKKFDKKTLMGILDMLDRAGKNGVDAVSNNGHALVAKKKGKCRIDLEVYDDEKQTKLLCTETVVTCEAEETEK